MCIKNLVTSITGHVHAAVRLVWHDKFFYAFKSLHSHTHIYISRCIRHIDYFNIFFLLI